MFSYENLFILIYSLCIVSNPEEQNLKRRLYCVLLGWGEAESLGTCVFKFPIVPAMDEEEIWNIWWSENWHGKCSEKTHPSATLSTINPT
jgi:hypothetical protein